MIAITAAKAIKSILSAIFATSIIHIFKKISLKNKNELNDIVSYSSCLIAASRAIETESKHALITDPLASILAGPKAMADKRDKMNITNNNEGVSSRIAIRTKYFDDYIIKTLKRGLVKQVVILGAGMDSRAYRLSNNADDVTFYEVDNQDVLQLKEKKLQQVILEQQSMTKHQLQLQNMIIQGSKRRKVIPCNIESKQGSGWSQPLLESGFDPNLPTIWVLEGLTYYISNELIMSTIFKTMRFLSTKSSSFIASIATLESINRAKNQSKSKLLQSWKWGTDDPNLFLTSNECGSWNVEDIVIFGSSKANFGRYKIKDGDTKRSGIMYVAGKC